MEKASSSCEPSTARNSAIKAGRLPVSDCSVSNMFIKLATVLVAAAAFVSQAQAAPTMELEARQSYSGDGTNDSTYIHVIVA